MPVLSVLAWVVLPRQEPKVSLELRGVRLVNAAETMAKTFGLGTVAIGPSIRDDVILVRCKDVDSKELQTNIAKALNATWTFHDNTWWLEQTPGQTAQEQAAFDAKRLTNAVKAVDSLRHKNAVIPTFDAAYCKKLQQEIFAFSKIPRTEDNLEALARRIEEIDKRGPYERFNLQVARRLTPQMFMKLRRSRPVVVFSNHPTRMQEPLPFSIDDLTRQLIAEQNLWVQVAGQDPITSKPKKKKSDDDDEDYTDLNEFGSLNFMREPMTADSASTITVTLHLDSESVEFSLYDKAGILTQSLFTSADQTEQTSSSVDSDVFAAEDPDDSNLSAESKSFQALLSPYEWVGEKRQEHKITAVDRKVLADILRPESVDPLSFVTPEGITQRVKGRNLVWVLPDDMFCYDRRGIVENQLKAMFTSIADSPTWSVCGLASPIDVREEAVNRKKMGTALRILSASPTPIQLEDFAQVVYLGKSTSQIFSALCTPAMNDPAGKGWGRINWRTWENEGLKIYGAMTPEMRRRIMSGPLSLSSLNAETRRELHESIFFPMRSNTGVSVDTENLPEDVAEKRQELISGGIWRDPTAALPDGLEPGFTLTAKEESHPTLGVRMKFKSGAIDQETLDTLGMSTRSPEDPSSFGANLFREDIEKRKPPAQGETQSDALDGTYDRDHISLMTERTITVTLHARNGLIYEWAFGGTSYIDPRNYSLRDLPEAIYKEIQRGYEDARREAQNQQQDSAAKDGAKKVPPPLR